MSEVFLGSVYATLEMRNERWDQSINQAKSQLDTLEGQTNAKMASLGKSFTNAGKALSVGLTVPLVLFGKSAVDSATTIETKWKEVQKVYGSTANAFQRDNEMLQKSVENLSVKFGKQKNEVLDALGAIAAIGYEGPKAVDILTQSMEFATTGNMDLNRAMEGTVAISKIYGVEGEALRKVLANLNLVENSTAASMEDLNEAVQIAGSVSKLAGVDVKELSGYMAVLREKAIPAGEAANGLKTIFTRLRGTAVGDLEAVGIAVDMGNGKLKEGDVILSELSKKWGKLTDVQKEEISASAAGLYQKNKFLAIMDDLSSKNSTYSNTLRVLANDQNSVNTYTKEMNVFLDTSKTKIEQAKVQWENMKVAVGAILVEALLPVVNALKDLAKWFSTLDPRIKKTAVYFGIFLAVLGPLLLILGAIVTAVGTLGIGLLPLIAIIAGIGVVIGGLVFFGKQLSEVFSAIGEVVQFIVGIVGETLAVPLRRLKELFGQLQIALLQLKPLFDALKPVLEIIGMVIGVILVGALTLFLSLVTGLIAAFIQIVTGIVQFFTGIIQAVTGFFQMIIGLFTGNEELIKTGWQAFTTGLYNILAGFIKVATAGFKAFIEAIINFFKFLYQKVQETVDLLIFGVILAFTALWNVVVEIITAMVNAVVGWFTSLWNSISSIVSNIKNWVVGRFTEAKDALVNIGNGIFHAIFDPLQNLWNKVVEFVNKIKEKLKEVSPFHRESPSLVDLVTKGVSVIKSQYESLGGITMPHMADLAFSPASVDVIKGASPVSNSNYVTNSPSFNVSIGMYAGSEMEKRAIAKELNNALLDYQKGTGEGVVR